MAHLIDKDALIAEIKRLAEVGRTNVNVFDETRKEKAVWLQQVDVCDRILSFTNTLEVKEVDLEVEPVSEDLEQAAEDYSGKKQDKLNNAFKAGAEWQKEQMMKDAVQGWVFKNDGIWLIRENIPQLTTVLSKYNHDDEIKVIILPSDNK